MTQDNSNSYGLLWDPLGETDSSDYSSDDSSKDERDAYLSKRHPWRSLSSDGRSSKKTTTSTKTKKAGAATRSSSKNRSKSQTRTSRGWNRNRTQTNTTAEEQRDYRGEFDPIMTLFDVFGIYDDTSDSSVDARDDTNRRRFRPSFQKKTTTSRKKGNNDATSERTFKSKNQKKTGNSNSIDHRENNTMKTNNSDRRDDPGSQSDPEDNDSLTEVRLEFSPDVKSMNKDSIDPLNRSCLGGIRGLPPPNFSAFENGPVPYQIDQSFEAGTYPRTCLSKNRDTLSLVERLKEENIQGIFPSARMVPDFDSKNLTVIGEKADKVNGVMGVPSDKFLEAKGPQSLYAYEYSKNENMDISYSKFSEDPISSLVVRKCPVSSNANDSKGTKILIQVEASTTSETDCHIRKGLKYGKSVTNLPNTPGVDVVGKVVEVRHTTAFKFDLHPGQTVLSLVKTGGNARYISLQPEKLVKVPENVDPAQAACLPETYLSAFQMLHHGQAGNQRYAKDSLRGKSVLIIGNINNSFGKALVELAMRGGCSIIYLTAKKKHWNHLMDHGIIPLSKDRREWIQRVEGLMDLVLAEKGELREDITYMHCRALSETGHLITCGQRTEGNDIPVGDWDSKQRVVCPINRDAVKLKNKTHSYDVYSQWDKDLETCKKDLVHLLDLLGKKKIKPTVLDRIPLNKVPKAHRIIESKKGLSGFIICEPWLQTKNRALYL